MDGSTLVWTAENVGDAVWVSDPDRAWVAASIVSFDAQNNTLNVAVQGSSKATGATSNNNNNNNNNNFESDPTASFVQVHLDSNGCVDGSPRSIERKASSAIIPPSNVPSAREKARAARRQKFVAMLLPRDTGHDAMGNMDDLSYLHSASVLNNIGLRFDKDLIYTRTGPILVAMNPFKWLPELFSPHQHHLYRVSNYEDLPPHCFAEVEASYRKLAETGLDQALVICGESGAGKTETTRLMLGYLSGIHHSPSAATGEGRPRSTTNNDASAEPHARDHQELIARRIMKSNPLMEAFGNAKTVRNNNSSR
jgi:myosin heavy subunit